MKKLSSWVLSLGVLVSGALIFPQMASANSTHYYLPWQDGVSNLVVQGEAGSGSHYTTVNYHAFDFDLDYGEVWAAAPGEIKAIVRSVNNQTSSPNYGNYVKLQHPDGSCTKYAHLAYGTVISADVGDFVDQGQKLGQEGNTGYTLPAGSGYHLHFQRESCSSGNSQEVDFAEVAEPQSGNTYISQNTNGGGSKDAGPAAAVSDNQTLAVNHTSRDEINSTRVRAPGSSAYSTVGTGVSSDWATAGTSDIASDPTQPGTFWTAVIKDTSGATFGLLYVYEVEGGVATQRAKLSVGAEDDQWSLGAPPSITVDRWGNVYVAAVQTDGGMSFFKVNPRSSPAYNVGRVDVGNPGSWSKSGTVNLALGPDDSIWFAAVTKAPISEVRTYRSNPHSLTLSYQGVVGINGWSVDAAPVIVVDDDYDVTVLAVKADQDNKAALWSYHNIDGQPDNWRRITDDVGANQEWSTHGSINVGVNPNDRVYVVGVRSANADGGEVQVFMMQPGTTPAAVTDTVWASDQQLGNTTTWSEYSAPALATSSSSDLSVWAVAVNRDGNMYAWKRNGSTGAWSSFGQIGGDGWAGNQL